MTVELRDLRWAIIASQHRSLRQAAETLNVRQSTLSRRLRDLEYRLGARLFERSNGGTRPTQVGWEFLATARRIVEETDAALGSLRKRCQGESGHLAIGICMALSAGNFRATLIEHQRRFPDVELRAVDGARRRLLSDLAAGALDVVIMAAGYAAWNDRTLPLWSERVVVALPDGHRLAAQRIVQWRDLAEERILVTQRDPGPDYAHLLRARLGLHAKGHLIEHRIALDRLLSLVGAGLGITLISEGATGAAYAGVTYREMHDSEGPVRLNFVAYWRAANDNPTVTVFLNMLRERHPDLSGDPEDR